VNTWKLYIGESDSKVVSTNGKGLVCCHIWCIKRKMANKRLLNILRALETPMAPATNWKTAISLDARHE
jgi:hypothetical protein